MSKFALGYVCFPQSTPVFKAQMALVLASLTVPEHKSAIVGIVSHLDYREGYDIQIVTENDSPFWDCLKLIPNIIQWEINAGTDHWPTN